VTSIRPNRNITCDDGNICTINDVCVNGTCSGVKNVNLQNSANCSAAALSPKAVTTTATIAFTVVGSAAAVAAIVGVAFLVKKVRDSKLLNPESWNPDMFSNVAANPLYKGSSTNVDNRLYEGTH